MKADELFYTLGYSANVSVDGTLLYIGRYTGLRIYDMKSKELIRIVKSVKEPRWFRICGDLLAYSNMLTVKIIDLKTEKTVKILRTANGVGNRFANELFFLNDHQLLYLSGLQDELKLYDLSSDKTYTLWSSPLNADKNIDNRICHITCQNGRINILTKYEDHTGREAAYLEILYTKCDSLQNCIWTSVCRIYTDEDADLFASRFASEDGKNVYIPYIKIYPTLSRIVKYDINGNQLASTSIPVKMIITGFDTCDKYFSVSAFSTRYTIDAATMEITDEMSGLMQIAHICDQKDYFCVSHAGYVSLFHVSTDDRGVS